MTTVMPPWGNPRFLTEEGLRAAQEYYFQTHATSSRLIAEARNAQGFAKSMLRRKLSRELGDDFKMYTGTDIGTATGAEEMSSLGIRGELNGVLRHIYNRIAPGKAITSPAQEDVTILKHPHGALEVCYAMTFYYSHLLRQYASFASNRRKVLKSIMDEELFKWIWRMVIGFMLRPEAERMNLEDPHLSAGLGFIPQEHQRVTLGAKIHEIGQFLLSKNLAESHLRIPLCYLYAVYVRQLLTLVATRLSRQELDDIYTALTRRVEGEPVGHPLAAVDALLNGKGTSMESFDEVLRDEEQVLQFIPAEEYAFINQFEDFGNPQRIKTTLRKLVPDVRRESIDGQETSLMPLMLSLRVMSGTVRQAVLGALPVPLLIMLRNRLHNAAQDDVARDLGSEITLRLEARRGESYTVPKAPGADKGAVATSVRVAPPKSAAPAAVTTVHAPPPKRAPHADSAAPQPTPAEKPASAPTAEKPARPSYLEEPSLLAWRMDGDQLAAISLSARELFALAGGEMRFLVAWVVFTLRTGQVFGLSPEHVTKSRVEQLVQALKRQAGDRPGEIPAAQLLSMVKENVGATQSKLLVALVKAAGLRPYLRVPEALKPALEGLQGRFGARLLDFLRNPNDEAFAPLRRSLTAEERQALGVLQRVARG